MIRYLTGRKTQRYTQIMKQYYSIFLVLFFCLELASCAPGHSGATVVAFVRDGQLWTIDPNGSNAFAVVAQSTPVIGYTWSPNHQILSFRTLDPDFAKTAAGKNQPPRTLNGLLGDLPSTLSAIGVDGGTPINTAFSSPDFAYSDAQWIANGTRLLYRQTPKNFFANTSNAQWWIAQNDQPGGIAAKPFPGSYAIPSISYDAQHYRILGNSVEQLFTTDLAGAHLEKKTIALTGHPLPASLERLLWRPAHQNQSFLYAIEDTSQDATSVQASTPLKVQLLLHTLEGPSGGTSIKLATCTCTQFAWSPDGNAILYSTGTEDTILNLKDHTRITVKVEATGIPYWSPDSQFLLLDGPHTLALVSMASRTEMPLLTQQPLKTPDAPVTVSTTNALLQPTPNSIWSADSRHFIFLAQERLSWQQHALAHGQGLYTVAIDQNGHVQAPPDSIATDGKITQIGWTYEDPNTAFLY